jgi:hypothetical protein
VTVNTKSFNEQYGGWDALNNNVSSNLISKYKKIEVKKSSSLYLADYEFDDSLLTNTSYITSRESGVKTTAYDFNLPLISGSIPVTGSLSNIDYKTSFMLFADWAGNSLAEKYGTSNYHIKWLIDEDGNVFKPQESSLYYWNTDQAFGASTPVNVSVYSGDGNISQDYETTIHMPLKNYNVVLYTETGSLGTDYLQPGFYNNINFESNNTELLFAFNSNLSLNYTSSGIVKFNNVINESPKQNYSTSTGIYTCNTSSGLLANVEVSLEVYNSDAFPQNITVEIYKSGSLLDSFVINSIPSLQTGIGSSIIETTLEENDTFYVSTNISSGDYVVSSVSTYFKINSISANQNISSTNIWLTNIFTSNSNTLTSSLDLGAVYSGAYKQTPIFNSGFGTPLTFNIKQYDQIRFEGNENYIFTIMNVRYENGYIYLTLDKNIPTTIILGLYLPQINIDNFSIRRLVNDIGFIMINNNPQQQTGISPSFIIPKYPSDKLKNNLDNIIQNLYQKNLL